jgi:hypothetical protein
MCLLSLNIHATFIVSDGDLRQMSGMDAPNLRCRNQLWPLVPFLG